MLSICICFLARSCTNTQNHAHKLTLIHTGTMTDADSDAGIDIDTRIDTARKSFSLAFSRSLVLQLSPAHTALNFPATRCAAAHCNTRQQTATRFNTLQHTATRCNTLHYTLTHCNTLQHAATHCNTLQHTAAHCNTLPHPHSTHIADDEVEQNKRSHH